MNRDQILGKIRRFLTLLAGVCGASGSMDGQPANSLWAS